MIIGYCRYCGEGNILDCPDNATQDTKILLATKSCKCDMATQEREKEEEIERAKLRIKELFGDGAEKMGFEPIVKEEIHQLMNTIVELVSNGIIRGTTVEISGGIKAKLNISSKGKINIERSETIKYKLEA